MRDLFFFLVISLFGMSGGFAKSVKVNSVQGFAKAQEEIVSGDSIIWISGIYSNMAIELNMDNVFFCI